MIPFDIARAAGQLERDMEKRKKKQAAAQAAAQAREDELTNLQDWREEQMKTIPFDPWVFINRENKRISNLVKSLRIEAHK